MEGGVRERPGYRVNSPAPPRRQGYSNGSCHAKSAFEEGIPLQQCSSQPAKAPAGSQTRESARKIARESASKKTRKPASQNVM